MEDSSFKFGVIRATSMEKSNILTIFELCEIAGVSRSGYYAWLSSEQKRAAREAQDAADFQQILEAYRFRGYAKGVRGIHMRLLHTGVRMNGKKIRRLMKKIRSCLSDPQGKSIKKETILHSDQGCHYTCIKFIQLVKNSSLRQSMSRKGNCWDNAPQESFFGHMKDELAEMIPNWTCFADVQRSIDDWMDYYNNDRYRWDLAKLSPNEYYRYLTTGRYPC